MVKKEWDDEVDFVLRNKGTVVAIEVKSNAEKQTVGLNKFRESFYPNSAFIVGDGGISAEEFLSMDTGNCLYEVINLPFFRYKHEDS